MPSSLVLVLSCLVGGVATFASLPDSRPYEQLKPGCYDLSVAGNDLFVCRWQRVSSHEEAYEVVRP